MSNASRPDRSSGAAGCGRAAPGRRLGAGRQARLAPRGARPAENQKAGRRTADADALPHAGCGGGRGRAKARGAVYRGFRRGNAEPYRKRAEEAAEEAEEKYDFLKSIVSLLKEKLHYVKEITDHISIFFGDKVEVETEEGAEFLKMEHIPTLVNALEEKISEVDVLTEETVQAILKSIQKEYKIKGKNLYMGTRIPLTGQMHGGDLAKTMVILGKDVCLKRLAYAKENLI